MPKEVFDFTWTSLHTGKTYTVQCPDQETRGELQWALMRPVYRRASDPSMRFEIEAHTDDGLKTFVVTR